MSVFTGFEPFAFYRDGELVGFDIDILRSFAAGASLEASFVTYRQFDKLWLCPGRGDSDIAAAGIARFNERLCETVAWSDPYYEVNRSILVHRADAAQLRGIDDFDARTIAFVAGSTAELDTRARAPGNARLVPISDQPEGMSLLRSGEIDGLAMGTPSNSFNQLQHPDFRLVDVHGFVQSERLRFPVSAMNQSLLAALNLFIAQGMINGDIAAYLKRWM